MRAGHERADQQPDDPRGGEREGGRRHAAVETRAEGKTEKRERAGLKPDDDREVDVDHEGAFEKQRIGEQPPEKGQPADDEQEGEQAGEDEAADGEEKPAPGRLEGGGGDRTSRRRRRRVARGESGADGAHGRGGLHGLFVAQRRATRLDGGQGLPGPASPARR